MREPVQDKDRVSAKEAPKVNVEMYMEAACPGCQFFTTHVLVPVLEEEGMADITDLHVIAAGNADIKNDEKTKTEVVECQHGEGECEGNKIISCLAKEHRADPKFVETLGCIEEHSAVASDVFSTLLSNLTAAEMLRTNANICMKNNDIDASTVDSCSSSPEGEQMLRDAIERTNGLKPKFEYAPWVLVDGLPLRDEAYSLKKFICDSYTGPLPAACASDKLKDYYPTGATATLSSKEGASAKSSALKEGAVRGSNRSVRPPPVHCQNCAADCLARFAAERVLRAKLDVYRMREVTPGGMQAIQDSHWQDDGADRRGCKGVALG